MLDVDPLPIPPHLDSRFRPDDRNNNNNQVRHQHHYHHPLAALGCRPPSQLPEGMDRDPPDAHLPPADDPGGLASRVNRTSSAREPHTQAAAGSSRSRSSTLLGGLLTTNLQLEPGSGGARLEETAAAAPSSSTSQNASEINRVFTPAMSDSGSSGAGLGGGGGGGNAQQDSSQESQLLRLSQLAAAREKMPDVDASASPAAALSRKRMADGMVKHVRHRSSASPVRSGGGGHSRNISTVSVASTAGSRAEELAAELKTRLSYAMVKVNHGWQSHSIDQVETLASHASSPTSTTSTVPGRLGTSASPRLTSHSQRASNSSTPTSTIHTQFDMMWPDRGRAAAAAGLSSAASPLPQPKKIPTLAPPVSIQPSKPLPNLRRNSDPRYVPASLPHAHPHAHARAARGSPQTPGQPLQQQHTPRQLPLGTPVADPILFSPHQNVREQDAIESLIFMSSPGNSANLKHTFPTTSSSSQPLPSSSARNGGASVTSSPHRTALPGSQPRKSLPSGRPTQQQQQSHSQPTRRVGFEKSPSNLSEMDMDDSFGSPYTVASPYSRGTPRRKVNGGGHEAHGPRTKAPLPMPSGLSTNSKPRPALVDADIDKMLDLAAVDDSSDSEEEILIPPRLPGAGSVGI